MNPFLMTLAAAFVLAFPTAPVNAADATATGVPRRFVNQKFQLDRDDVVAWIGGTDVAAALHSGHLESLLAAANRGRQIRFRNFGWEGDTVFDQPRDVGFPPLTNHLEKAGATVILIQFGRAEALEGRTSMPRFRTAYERLIDSCTRRTQCIVLVTPPPFENAAAPLPDLSARNVDLAAFVEVIRALARERELPLVDLFAELGGEKHRGPLVTQDGLQLSPRGHALVAQAFAKQIGLGNIARHAGEPTASGAWADAGFERVRATVIEKNKLWFNYWRPQNWAFLGGDRTSQPSSRDHRDPKVRWFPAEMEKFVPLIQQAEARIEVEAGKISLP